METKLIKNYDRRLNILKKLKGPILFSKMPFTNVPLSVLKAEGAVVKNDDGTYSTNGHLKEMTGEQLAVMVRNRWSKKPGKARASKEVGTDNVVAGKLLDIDKRLVSIESLLFRVVTGGKVGV